MVWLQKLCNIWHIKARQILFIVKQKFFVYALRIFDVVGFKQKRAEEREKGSQKATEKKLWGLCLDYAWQKLRVPELNKYLKHPRLEKHLTRHWLLQMNPEGTDLLQTRLRETETKLKMNLCQTVITTIVMKTTSVEAKAAVMRRMKMIVLTLVIETDWVMSFLHSSMTKRRSWEASHNTFGKSHNQKIRNWFLSFQYFFQWIQSELAHFFFADFVVHSSLLCTTKSAKKKFILQMHLSLSESDRCNCSMNCNTLIMPKTYCVTVQYVYLI